MHPMTVAIGSVLAAFGIEPQPYKASKIVSVSQLVTHPKSVPWSAGSERQQVMDIVRGATFVGTLLLGWISLHPFEDLGNMQIGDVRHRQRAGDLCGVRRASAVLTVALAMRDNDARGWRRLLSPAFVLFGAWLLVDGRRCRSIRARRSGAFADGLRCRGHRRAAAAAEIAAGIDALVHDRGAGVAGDLLSRNICWRRIFRSIWRPIRRSRGWPATGAARSATRTRPRPSWRWCCFSASTSFAPARGYPGVAVIAPGLAVPAVFSRKKLADAVLCGAAADVADVSRPLVLAARDHVADAAGCC